MNADFITLSSAVQAVGRHALQAYAAALVLLLMLAAALCWLIPRYGLRRPESRRPPLTYLVGYMSLGFLLIAGSAALFVEIAGLLGNGKTLGQLDQVLSDTLRATLSTDSVLVFAALTHLGDPLTLTVLGAVVAILLAWQRCYGLCISWIFALAGNAVLNPFLKNIFQRIRPVHDEGRIFADGWSFPSGHTSGSVVSYGMLAYVLVRLLPPRWSGARMPAVMLMVAIAFTTGISRVFIQVHFASDVLAGFASGTAWLAMCIGASELARYRQSHLGR